MTRTISLLRAADDPAEIKSRTEVRERRVLTFFVLENVDVLLDDEQAAETLVDPAQKTKRQKNRPIKSKDEAVNQRDRHQSETICLIGRH
jgi:hypothetical protein